MVDDSGYKPAQSLRDAINSQVWFGKSDTLIAFENRLEALNIIQILSDNPNTPAALNHNVFSTMINPRKLCQLAEECNLPEIIKYNFGKEEIETIISDAVIGDPPSCLGHYNALLIAASYRHFDVVKFFVEEKNADVHIKGGRRRDFTALDCSKQLWWTWLFDQKLNPELSVYLAERMRHPQQAIIANALQQLFLRPPQAQPAELIREFPMRPV